MQDVDLKVIEQNQADDVNGKVVAVDDGIDNTPVCRFTVRPGEYYRLEHKNAASVGGRSGFIFSCLLKE